MGCPCVAYRVRMGYRTLDDLINDVGKTVPKSSKVHPLPLLFMLDTNDVVLMLPMRSVLVRYYLRWSIDGLGESRGTCFLFHSKLNAILSRSFHTNALHSTLTRMLISDGRNNRTWRNQFQRKRWISSRPSLQRRYIKLTLKVHRASSHDHHTRPLIEAHLSDSPVRVDGHVPSWRAAVIGHRYRGLARVSHLCCAYIHSSAVVLNKGLRALSRP